ncbi:signal recognition particle-docking protein FtsY [Actinospica sp. MGRD01-02]|uniref:Signal recognition particle receptor FtsY n=1 Tax=Actinospica acidithermotolerans TaxID=2828514 RepID=A0A941E4C5_9ACTN|nr:signal recognition particle-docking protein FtsY [Actinospica acidithermotolerans]MBR7824916.1 signal recognition particle-docking protein FtsY [Actinospica acidithermotolerans]
MVDVIIGVIAGVLFASLVAALVVRGRNKRADRFLPPSERRSPDDLRLKLGEAAEREDEGASDLLVEGKDSIAVDVEQLEKPKAALEAPEPSANRLVRLRSRLARSNSAVGKGLLSLLSRDKLDEDTWEEIEEVLLTSDLGIGPTQELVEALRTRTRVLGTRTPDELRELLKEELLKLVDPELDRTVRSLREDGEGPAVVLVAGVNGVGKTTTTGKLARVLIADGRTVVLGAADTFRAAAADQLETWGDRVGATTVRGAEGADPASVAFEAVRKAKELGVDTALIDTAGRLHTKTGLMDELGKVKRVVEKQGPVDEVLLVLDATTGQNGLVQARVFREVVDITGIALTKLDGTAKGGIVIAVQRELGVPVKLVGLGEGADDLAPFDPAAFVDALVGS